MKMHIPAAVNETYIRLLGGTARRELRFPSCAELYRFKIELQCGISFWRQLRRPDAPSSHGLEHGIADSDPPFVETPALLANNYIRRRFERDSDCISEFQL